MSGRAPLPKGVQNLANRAHWLRREITRPTNADGSGGGLLERAEATIQRRLSRGESANFHRAEYFRMKNEISQMKAQNGFFARRTPFMRQRLAQLTALKRGHRTQMLRLDASVVILDRSIAFQATRIGKLNAHRQRLDRLIQRKGFDPVTLRPLHPVTLEPMG